MSCVGEQFHPSIPHVEISSQDLSLGAVRLLLLLSFCAFGHRLALPAVTQWESENITGSRGSWESRQWVFFHWTRLWFQEERVKEWSASPFPEVQRGVTWSPELRELWLDTAVCHSSVFLLVCVCVASRRGTAPVCLCWCLWVSVRVLLWRKAVWSVYSQRGLRGSWNPMTGRFFLSISRAPLWFF